tara:strand:+ start:2226 stop:3296 length:1071 start_codon:yes stop_codon:yes gene_type:complete
MKINHKHYLKLAFNLAKINLGKTYFNPSVGCVVVKNNSVISSGYTSKNGRPHAEFNALNLHKNFKDSALYVTMEPCTHYGQTPPCTKIIIKQKIKKVFFSFYDKDTRTAKKAHLKLSTNNIQSFKKFSNNYKDFYDSYFLNNKSKTPFIDGKIAVSKDYFTIKKGSKWITNSNSIKRVHLIRSQYDTIISTSKSINIDNSLLNCRLSGFENNKPDLVIIDLKLKLKKNLMLFKNLDKRKIYLVTAKINDKKISFFKKKGIKIIYINSLKNIGDFNNLLMILKKRGIYRILIEAGLTFLNSMIKNKLISNLYLFKSSHNLKKLGQNNSTNRILKRFSLKDLIKVNLKGDRLYKIKLK